MKVCIKTVLAALIVLGPTVAGARGDEAPVESKEQRDQRMAWWREARFGMFVHWGLYAVPAGEWDGKAIGNCGEWIMNWCHIPIARYAKLAEQFNPVKYDAERWVLAARDAGMKYIVMTAKHHEGFAMFPTAVDDYNIVDATPFKRDPIEGDGRLPQVRA